MQNLNRSSLRQGFRAAASHTTFYSRNASLTSAIGRGVREGSKSFDRSHELRRRREDERRAREDFSEPPTLNISRIESGRQSTWQANRDTVSSTSQDNNNRSRTALNDRMDRRKPFNHARILHANSIAPTAVPYTVAASEFLYGTFAVLAALRARRRQLYNLYIWVGGDNQNKVEDVQENEIVRLAKIQKINIERVAGDWDRMLDKMSGGRPHNGLVLEAANIPKIPSLHLEIVDRSDAIIGVMLAHMSREERAVTRVYIGSDGSTTLPRNVTRGKRFPLMLWLDRVTDTGNMGAIFRTAYYFGIDAIIVPEHGTAPLSAVTIKSSAGAAEHVPIITTKNELEFVKKSQEHGWRFFAAVAPGGLTTHGRRSGSHPQISASQAIHEGPCVLMLGNEANGLRPFLERQADYKLSVKGARRSGDDLDSLNVSVAAALLIDRFMAKPENTLRNTLLEEGASQNQSIATTQRNTMPTSTLQGDQSTNSTNTTVFNDEKVF